MPVSRPRPADAAERVRRTMRTPPPLLLTSAAVALTATVGGAADRRPLAVVPAVGQAVVATTRGGVGPVWSALYVLLAGAGARTLVRLEQIESARNRYVTAYAVNLILNAGWSWTFFRAKKLVPALTEVLLLEASTVDLARQSMQVDHAAGVALLPYAAWVTFATALTAELARRNRARGL